MSTDNSITALHKLRPGLDASLFWFRDDLHQPYPITPMGMTTIQKHHGWGYHAAAHATSFPASHGAHVKLHRGRVYLGFAPIEDAAIVAARNCAFSKLLSQCRGDWRGYCEPRMQEVRRNLQELLPPRVPASAKDALARLQFAERANRRHWVIHFELMYVADALLFDVDRWFQEHGISEQEADEGPSGIR